MKEIDDMANASLYGLELEFYEIMTIIEENEGEIPPEIEEQLKINQANVETKVKSYSYFINKLKGEQLAIKEEIARLSALSNRKANMTNRLKLALREATMLFGNKGKSGNKVLEFDTIKLYTRKNEVLLFSNEEEFYVPDYIKYSISNKLTSEQLGRLKNTFTELEISDKAAIDKRALKSDLQGGVIIDGVSLIRDDNIIIK